MGAEFLVILFHFGLGFGLQFKQSRVGIVIAFQLGFGFGH